MDKLLNVEIELSALKARILCVILVYADSFYFIYQNRNNLIDVFQSITLNAFLGGIVSLAIMVPAALFLFNAAFKESIKKRKFNLLTMIIACRGMKDLILLILLGGVGLGSSINQPTDITNAVIQEKQIEAEPVYMWSDPNKIDFTKEDSTKCTVKVNYFNPSAFEDDKETTFTAIEFIISFLKASEYKFPHKNYIVGFYCGKFCPTAELEKLNAQGTVGHKMNVEIYSIDGHYFIAFDGELTKERALDIQIAVRKLGVERAAAVPIADLLTDIQQND